jgi:uncharacterized membrane protein AbrB (regulator of aidB expression)
MAKKRQSTKPATGKRAPAAKKRGGWLSAWLVLMMIHGLFSAFLVLYLREQDEGVSAPWVLGILFLLAVAHIIATLAIWEWKRWGLLLYAGTIVVSIVVGLVLTASQLWVFHEVLPLAILGYLVKDKLPLFE